MKLREMSPIALAGLLLVVVVDFSLLLMVGTELLPENADGPGKIAWKTNLSVSPDTVTGQKPIDGYREILAHPVFFKSREPFVAPPLAPVAAAPPSPPVSIDPGLTLGGVMIRHESRKAYLLQIGNANGTWIKEGEEFQGWKLVSITSGTARLEKAGRSVDLSLYPH